MRIAWYGLWSSATDGFAMTNRRYARALSDAGCDVRLGDFQGFAQVEEDEAIAEVEDLVYRDMKDVDAAVYSWCWAGPTRMLHFLADLLMRAGPPIRIFYSMLERDRIDPMVASVANGFSQTWVPCRQSVRALLFSGMHPDRVKLVPHPILPDEPWWALAGRTREPGVPRGLWFGRWEPRKAPERLLRLWMTAFTPDEATLYIKTNKAPSTFVRFPSTPEEAVKLALARPEVQAKGWTAQNWHVGIKVLRGRFPVEQIISLQRHADFYCSAAYGEGVDLPRLQAAMAGTRCVGTHSGGPDDFIGSRDLIVPSAGSRVCSLAYGWEPLSRWPEYQDDAFVAALLRAAADVRSGSADAGFVRSTNLAPFAPAAVGRVMVRCLDEARPIDRRWVPRGGSRGTARNDRARGRV